MRDSNLPEKVISYVSFRDALTPLVEGFGDVDLTPSGVRHQEHLKQESAFYWPELEVDYWGLWMDEWFPHHFWHLLGVIWI